MMGPSTALGPWSNSGPLSCGCSRQDLPHQSFLGYCDLVTKHQLSKMWQSKFSYRSYIWIKDNEGYCDTWKSEHALLVLFSNGICTRQGNLQDKTCLPWTTFNGLRLVCEGQSLVSKHFKGEKIHSFSQRR